MHLLGLASGEGLIFEVRDPTHGDSGASDKRRLIIEAEFAQILKVLAREGNTLSPVVRNAWDGKPLADDRQERAGPRDRRAHRDHRSHHQGRAAAGSSPAPSSPTGSSTASCSSRSDEARSSRSAAGSTASSSSASATRPCAALRFASLPRQLTFDPHARERWIEVYGPLSRGEEGLLGAATRRAEAHVVRLAAIYATLDTSEQIAMPHLEAALAVWRYSLDSARWIFGDTLGDPTADEIWALAKDRPAGVTRSEVRDLFSRNKKAREIDRALDRPRRSRTPHPHQRQRRPRTTRPRSGDPKRPERTPVPGSRRTRARTGRTRAATATREWVASLARPARPCAASRVSIQRLVASDQQRERTGHKCATRITRASPHPFFVASPGPPPAARINESPPVNTSFSSCPLTASPSATPASTVAYMSTTAIASNVGTFTPGGEL